MNSESIKKIVVLFREFMTGIAKLDELSQGGSTFLSCFQQSLEFLRRPPLDMTSDLVKKLVAANETQWLKSYMESGCMNANDSIQNMSKLRSAKLGLDDHVKKAKEILTGLEGLLEYADNAIQNAYGHNSPSTNMDLNDDLDEPLTANHKDDTVLNHFEDQDIMHFAAMMGIIYSMVKQDHLMQEKIICALSLKSSAGELESYCLMWSLRPYINDEVMRQAWRHIS